MCCSWRFLILRSWFDVESFCPQEACDRTYSVFHWLNKQHRSILSLNCCDWPTRFCSHRPLNCWNFWDMRSWAQPTALRTFPRTTERERERERRERERERERETERARETHRERERDTQRERAIINTFLFAGLIYDTHTETNTSHTCDPEPQNQSWVAGVYL